MPSSSMAPVADAGILHSGEAERLALLAKALGHPARILIIETLLRRQTCIGCDIVEEIGLAASTTSEHLRILKEAGLITGEIARPRVCYALAPDAVAPLADFLARIRSAVAPSSGAPSSAAPSSPEA